MWKKKSETEPSEKEAAEPEKPEGLSEADTLPSELETEPESIESEGEAEEKAVPGPPKKKTRKGEIIGLMGVVHQEGPPGSTHG